MNPNENFFEKSQALNSSVIGFEFEFYSDMLKGRAAESLSKLLGKKVTVSEKYHSKLPIDSKNFKLEPEEMYDELASELSGFVDEAYQNDCENYGEVESMYYELLDMFVEETRMGNNMDNKTESIKRKSKKSTRR